VGRELAAHEALLDVALLAEEGDCFLFLIGRHVAQ
jgi:hypothetical protein